jgi:hypothetical protein
MNFTQTHPWLPNGHWFGILVGFILYFQMIALLDWVMATFFDC